MTQADTIEAGLQQLADDQLASFDTEFVNDARWAPVARCIARDFPAGRFTFLDVGGGSGMFADRILESYPEARVTVLDNSQLLLSRNKPNPRKELLLESVERLGAAVGDRRFDLISMNWLLHHLVSPSYGRTRSNIDAALRMVSRFLSDRGRLSVHENLYNGIAVDGAPGWIIHRVTSNKALAALARRGGANSAGVGVCFLSRRQWLKTFRLAGLEVESETLDVRWKVPWKWHVALHIAHIECGHYWLRPR